MRSRNPSKVKPGPPYKLHQRALSGADSLDRRGQLFESFFRNNDQAIFIPVQQIVRVNDEALNLNRHSHAHNVEVGVAGNCPTGQILKAQGPDFGDIAHGAIAYQAHGPRRWKIVAMTSPQ